MSGKGMGSNILGSTTSTSKQLQILATIVAYQGQWNIKAGKQMNNKELCNSPGERARQNQDYLGSQCTYPLPRPFTSLTRISNVPKSRAVTASNATS